MTITRICIEIPNEAPYDCRIGSGCSGSIGEKLRSVPLLAECRNILLVSDSNVAPLYAAHVKDSLCSAGFCVDLVSVPAGEQSKDSSVVFEIWNAMSQLGLNRKSAMCALGGGVVGDLAGFAAATYMRGIPIVHVPTSLLAMVDSSIGGKAGINLPQGKNLVGAFCQPIAVFADLDFLDTLPSRELRCGLAEVVKSSLLSEDDFFFWLDNMIPAYLEDTAQFTPELLHEMIVRCVVFKSGVVARDPFEKTDIRAMLNLGHTFGHAIEKCAGYARYSHGECVAEGIRFAARLAEAELDASPEFTAAQDALLDKIGLPVLGFDFDIENVLAAMQADKKNADDGVRFVLLEDLGKPVLLTIDSRLLAEYLTLWKEMNAR